MKIKEFLGKPLYICLVVLCAAVGLYFAILSFNVVRPKNYTEQKMHCLELGSDARAAACIKLINK